MINRSKIDFEEAAQGSLIKISPLKRCLIWLLEWILLPFRQTVRPTDSIWETCSKQIIHSILVIEYWNLGDIVILLPFLKNLRLHFPKAHIALVANPNARFIFEGEGLIDELIPMSVPWVDHHDRWRKYNPFSLVWPRLIKTLWGMRSRRFDLAITGRADIRDNFFARVIGAKECVGYGFGGGDFLLTTIVEPDLRRPHRSQLWLRLIEVTGREIVQTRPQLTLSGNEREAAEQFLIDNGMQLDDILVGIHPGSRITTREWGQRNFAKIAANIQAKFKVKILWFLEPGGHKQVIQPVT